MRRPRPAASIGKEQSLSDHHGLQNDSRHDERLRQIRKRLVEARRELDALIGDAYLRPRASIVPVHFLDLASAVEKLRWAEKEWRELDQASEDQAGADGDVSALHESLVEASRT